jgi:flagellar protein FlgJ
MDRQAEQAAQKLASFGELEGADRADIERAAKEFEGYFVAYMLKVMRETVPKGLFENKYGEQFYYFYDQEIGRLAAERGGLGFGTMILEQYSRQDQESSKNPLKSPLEPADNGDEPVKSHGSATTPRGQG